MLTTHLLVVFRNNLGDGDIPSTLVISDCRHLDGSREPVFYLLLVGRLPKQGRLLLVSASLTDSSTVTSLWTIPPMTSWPSVIAQIGGANSTTVVARPLRGKCSSGNAGTFEFTAQDLDAAGAVGAAAILYF